MAGESYYLRARGKVTGPFTAQQLKRLRDRGQLARFHELSADKQLWQQAGSFAELFPAATAAPPRSGKFPAVPVAIEVTVPPSAAIAQWLYVDKDGKQQGPVMEDGLLDLLATGAITDSTLVWREGMPEWSKLATAPLTLRSSWGFSGWLTRKRLAAMVFVCACVLAVIGLAGFWLFFLAADPTTSQSRTTPASSPTTKRAGADPEQPVTVRELAITSARDEKKIAAAVGFVVCGAQIVHPDGSQSDLVASTGSCFAVSPDGYLLTNRHVVEEVANLRNAKLLLKKIQDEQLVDIKPTVWVFFGNQKYVADIHHLSDDFDLALLKVARQDSPFFRLARSDSWPRGTKAIACGFPGIARKPLSPEEALGQVKRDAPKIKVEKRFSKRDFEYTMTDGAVSRVTTEEGAARRWIQHTANINAGNSGGPLLHENGTVIAMNTLSFVKAYPGVSGVFFSLSMDQFKTEIEKHVRNVVWE